MGAVEWTQQARLNQIVAKSWQEQDVQDAGWTRLRDLICDTLQQVPETQKAEWLRLRNWVCVLRIVHLGGACCDSFDSF